MNNSKTMMKTGAAALLLMLQLFVPAAPAAARMIENPDPTEEGGDGTSGGGLPPYHFPPPGGFNSSMPQRFSKWTGAWRQRGTTKAWPTETYDSQYVNPTSWPVSVMGCRNANDFLANRDPAGYRALQIQAELDGEPDKYPDQTTQYRWQWNGENTGFTKDCFGKLPFPAQGTYYVTLTVRYADGDEESWTNPVEVKDFLIVVLGDSSASGEGAPDVPLDQSSTGRAEWVDNRCHRSNNAGGAQAASRLENGGRSSVTFLSFACSGATLITDTYDSSMPDPYELTTSYPHRGTGITGPFAGIEPVKFPAGSAYAGESDFSYKLPGQIDQLWNALTNFGAHQPRKIDALIVAGGINDARFADLAAVCTLFNFCDTSLVQVGEYTTVLRSLDDQFEFDIQRIPGGWAEVRDQLLQPRGLKDGTIADPIEPTHKLALQYPPFFRDDDGERCLLGILGDALPWWIHLLHTILYPFPLNVVPPGWYADEIAHGDTVWAPHLNDKVRDGSIAAGFKYVDTIANRFSKHGICADDRWINTPTDSAERQGDADGRESALDGMSSKGSAHPNTKGYSAYADEILRHLNTLTKKDGNTPPVAVWDKVKVSYGKARVFNVLANDLDEDPGDVLAARIASQPLHGKVTMQIDGTVTYTPTRGFDGIDSFTYEVTDGQDAIVGPVFITVMKPIRYLPRVIAGQTAEIGGLLGGLSLVPPYRLEFDKPLRPERGNFYFEPDDGILYYDAPPLRRRRIRLDYTLYSDTTDVHSPSYGESTRGILILRVRR